MKRSISHGLALLFAVFATGCGNLGVSLPTRVPWSKEVDSNVVYALGSRDAFASPLNRSLKPACPALRFRALAFQVTPEHEKVLRALAEVWSRKPGRYLIIGYAPPELPEDHARSLSERRAQAVRQRLIEMGIEAADLQTAGFGNDFGPSGPNQDVVVIFSEDSVSSEPDQESDDSGEPETADLITVRR